MKTKIILLLSVLITGNTFDVNAKKGTMLYSQQMVENRALKSFYNNKNEYQLKTAKWGYVTGLVAYSVLKAWQQYPDKMEYYNSVKAYADYALAGTDTVYVEDSNIDDLAAGKIFFTLYQTELKKGNISDAERYKRCATYLRNTLKYKHKRIEAGKPSAGSFFHKGHYTNQVWLDGLYMGPAMYAEWQANFGLDEGPESNIDSWSDIAMQFKNINHYTYDSTKKLNYHGWSATPTDSSSFWAKQSEPHLGCSPEFWARGMGWYFAALVDVLEIMPENRADYSELVKIANQVAYGLKFYQDKKSGCWYQLLQYDNTFNADGKGDEVNGKKYNAGDNPNYLESSASSMFTYAYLKGIRIGILDKEQYIHVAIRAYKGLLKQFIRDNGSDLDIIQSCASAGLGPAKDKFRTGTTNYYLCGKDTRITQNEGKAIGPFIMASLEYELLDNKEN